MPFQEDGTDFADHSDVFRTVLDPQMITVAIKSRQKTFILGPLHSVNVRLTKHTLTYDYILRGLNS
jgi:hypothetical protein